MESYKDFQFKDDETPKYVQIADFIKKFKFLTNPNPEKILGNKIQRQ